MYNPTDDEVSDSASEMPGKKSKTGEQRFYIVTSVIFELKYFVRLK